MNFDFDPIVLKKINSYPEPVKSKLLEMRQLIIDCAVEDSQINKLQETLKWGEPSYISNIGSTLRFDWKSKRPEEVAMFFKCTSKIVPTIKEVFGDKFEYENNRALWFKINERLNANDLRECILMALKYHRLKKLSLLGYLDAET